MPRLDVIPFESEYQYMATLHEKENWDVTSPTFAELENSNHKDPSLKTIYVKGSVEAIVSRCQQVLDKVGNLTPLQPEIAYREAERMAERGLRVLALAKKLVPATFTFLERSDIETDLVFLGLQGIIDPPRTEAIQAIRACQSAGIEVKMITGDHCVTAKAIASSMGLQQQGEVLAFTGREVAQMNQRELTNAVTDGVVFARVAPEQKLLIVETLQATGKVVAMTGDGVNDAPALKQADIGIAMGKAGTEVAKEAADTILTDDNFASIEAAVEEGRTVYRNLLKAIAFILPVNGGESMTIVISVLLARALPILSLQVLWLNMINSLAMTVPLAFEPRSPRVMKQPPRPANEPLLDRKLLIRILVISLFNWLLIFGVFEWINTTTGNIALARTMAIQALVVGRIFYLLSISHLGTALVSIIRGKAQKITDAPAIVIGIFGTIILQVIFSQWSLMNDLFSTAPLNFNQWLFCLLVGLPIIPVAALVNRFDPLD